MFKIGDDCLDLVKVGDIVAEVVTFNCSVLIVPDVG